MGIRSRTLACAATRARQTQTTTSCLQHLSGLYRSHGRVVGDPEVMRRNLSLCIIAINGQSLPILRCVKYCALRGRSGYELRSWTFRGTMWSTQTVNDSICCGCIVGERPNPGSLSVEIALQVAGKASLALAVRHGRYAQSKRNDQEI